MQSNLEFDDHAGLIGEPDIAQRVDAADDAGAEGTAPAAAAPLSDLTETISEPRVTPCRYVTGRAGTGKTFWAKQQIAADPAWGLLSATTGIAAMNLDTITINAALGYFDTDSLRDAYLNGRLTRRLHEIALQYRNLVVDEASMLAPQQLDMLYRATVEANAYIDVKSPLGIILVGDFAQLPAVNGGWAFAADCWEHFAASTTRLNKVWRQDEPAFLDALNAARCGDGVLAADLLTKAGIQWHSMRDPDFEGTTIVSMNKSVSRHNIDVLSRHPGQKFSVVSRRWGKQRSEWGENSRTKEWGIPPSVELKVGAYVMLLANHPQFEYVNGDCGTVVGHDTEGISVELVRNTHTILLPKLVRDVSTADKPESWSGPTIAKGEDVGAYIPRPHYRAKKRTYVLGQVEFYPLRLAWCSTVHKSQGLSLDNTQIDFRDAFFGQPAMLYTAISRCRTLAGLRMVGQPEIFAKRCNIDSRIKPWL